MNTHIITAISFMILFTIFTKSSLAADIRTDAILPAPIQVSEHVYAWIGPYGGPNVENKGFRMNLAFVVGTDAVAVLESGFYPKMAESMIAHIRNITSVPIKYVINSNSQPDRYFGNDAFAALGAKIYAHEKEIQRMQIRNSDFATFVEISQNFPKSSIKLPRLPNERVTAPTTLNLGKGVSVQLSFHKAGHTPAPLIVAIPSDKVVYAGDILYSGRLPAIVNGGNIKEWIETFDHLRQFKGATFIPGHGEPASLDAFEHPTYQYLVKMYTHMKMKIEEGVEMQEATDSLDQSDFAKLENFNELAKANASNAYLELEQALF